MSWPLLLPVCGARVARRDGVDGARVTAANGAGFACGLLLFGTLLIPTLIAYGAEAGSGGTLRNFHPHWVNPWIAVDDARPLFFVRQPRNLRVSSRPTAANGSMFLLRHWWLTPIAAVVWLVGRRGSRSGCCANGFAPSRRLPSGGRCKWLVAGTVVLVYASYWFVMEPPQAHAFYVVAPLAFMFAAYCWTFVDSPRWRRIAAARSGRQHRVPRRAGVDSGTGDGRCTGTARSSPTRFG